METEPDISIVIPVYNGEKWIVRCLNSILKQTFGNFEIIIVNDASSDKSLEIAMGHAQEDSRIVIINNKKNEGTMFARESGYKSAQGKYIIFSDADDYFPENAFQILYDKITVDNSDIVFGGYTLVGNNQSEINVIREIPSGCSSNEVQYLLLQHKLPNTLWGNIYSAKLFKHFPPLAYIGMTNAEDRMLLIQLIYNARKINFTPSSTYYYCQNSQSNSHPRISDRVLKNIIFSNDWCYQYLVKKGFNYKDIISYHLYRIRYLLEIGYKMKNVLIYTKLDKRIYTFTAAINHVNLLFSIHFLSLQKSQLYRSCYSGLKSFYHMLSKYK